MNDVEYRIPSNFSWVEDNLIAGSSFPKHPSHLRWLVDEAKITHLVTLNAESQPPINTQPPDKLRWTQIKIKEFHPPTPSQIDQMMKIILSAKENGNERVCVHCTMGRGRTGTMLSCWLVMSQNLNAEEAIAKIRELRPHSIETTTQEDAVRKFHASHMRRLQKLESCSMTKKIRKWIPRLGQHWPSLH